MRTLLRARFLLPCAAAALAACSHPQRPYAFSGTVAPDRTTQLLVDALAAEGLHAAAVDPAAGVIVTTWTDTGYRFQEQAPLHENALSVERTVFRRYQVAVLPDGASGGTTVRLQVEAKRCRPDTTVRDQHLVGDCQELERFFPALQTEMDDLGRKLRDTSANHAT